MNKLLYQIVTLTLLSSFSYVSAQKVDQKPNILLILVDDLGSIDLNCYGSTDLITPNLNQLAKEGVRFTQFYAGAPLCSPSRASLLTGKSNLGAGMPKNTPSEDKDPTHLRGLPAGELTIAELLKKHGYYTALIGKWHLGHGPEKSANAQGFDYFYGHQGGCIDNYSHFFYWSGPNRHDLYRNEEEVFYPGQYFPDLMANEVEQVIERTYSDPFFIYWAINAPHYPYQGKSKWLGKYADLESPRKEYAAFVSSIDETIGKVLNKLKDVGKEENTIVIFQSDHGHSYEERAFSGGGNSGPYRGGKTSMFEGGLRVPAMIRWPNVVPEDEIRDQILSGMDWFPTIAEAAQADIASLRIEGKSLMPIIRCKIPK